MQWKVLNSQVPLLLSIAGFSDPTAQVARNQGVGASIKQILSSLNATYGNVLPFDMLMRQFVDVS